MTAKSSYIVHSRCMQGPSNLDASPHKNLQADWDIGTHDECP